MAEELSLAQLRQQQAEERERMDEEWMAIAEERGLLDEEKKEVMEEKTRFEERRRLFEEGRSLFEEERRLFKEERRLVEEERIRIQDDRRKIEDKRSMLEHEEMLMHEDRQKMTKEREDFDRLRENALKAARRFVELDTRGLEDRSSSSSPEGRPAKRLRRTPGGPQMPPAPTALPRSSRNGTDPLGLSTASDEIKNIWRQLELPQEWTGANSDNLLELLKKHTGRKVLPGARPVALLDRLAAKDSCLINNLRKLAPKLDNGPAHPCSVCRNKAWPCIAIDFAVAEHDEPYDEDGQAKRWKLSIRNDGDDEE